MDNLSIKERIRQFCDTKGFSVRYFEKMCGLSNGYVSSMRKGIGQEKLQSILKAFPELNRDWLLFGDKGMCVQAQSVGDNNTGVNIIGNNSNSPIDNRKYYSDSPDVLRSQIESLEREMMEKLNIYEERIKEKDAQIKEKDAQIKEKDAQIKEKDAQIKQLLNILQEKAH